MAVSPIKIRLNTAAELAVKQGHPWVFGDSIKQVSRVGEAGELAVVYDKRDRVMAIGLWDPESPIRMRVVHWGGPVKVDRAWWVEQAKRAKARRAVLEGRRTDGYRCINGDSEGFPGLVADWYAGTLVVKIYTAAWVVRWEEIESVLREVFEPRKLVLRMARHLEDETGLKEGYVGEDGEDCVIFEENGIRFESWVVSGQKTGFFLDQRENRERVEGLARGREVLNVFSFTGGFSMYAARGGAKSVTDVDISRHALAGAERNFALNDGFGGARHRVVQADAFGWMSEAQDEWDLIIVDPPSLAKREREREGALAAYRRLNRDAMGRLRPGGVLVAASCSAHVRTAEFIELVKQEAQRSQRQWRVLWQSGHALDHPSRFAESEYLKAIAIEVGRES